MPFALSSKFTRRRPDLPPGRRVPRIYETLCCRWLPASYINQSHACLGDRFTVYPIDMPPLVFLADPGDIRAVLTADSDELHPGAGSAIIAPLIGERSFMLLEEEDHLCARRAITPAFHQRVVAQHTTTLTETVEQEIQSWPLERVIALDPRIRALTLKVILRVIFGEDSLPSTLHIQLMNLLSVTASLVLQEPKVRYLPGWHKTWLTFIKQRAEVDAVLYRLMHERRAEIDHTRGDLLDMLLAAKNPDGSPMSDREIRDNLMSMILAGHETTTGELAWAFQLLAHNPAVQSQLAANVDNDESDAYLTAVINETLRHKPVFLFAIPRKVVEPVEIGGWTYRPPAHLVACTYLMHHNPELYPEPHRFLPERFIGQTPQSRTWLPWGGGRKHCLGRHFALMEVKAILRAVISTRKVLPASKRMEHPRWRSAILVPHAGCRVILNERKARANAHQKRIARAAQPSFAHAEDSYKNVSGS